MNIIGLGGSVHDFATCIITDDGQTVAVEDERLTRIRYALKSANPCEPSLEYCLRATGRRLRDVEVVVGNDMLENPPRAIAKKMIWMNHHLAHAFSAFFSSPFESAAILVADGAGSVVGGDAKTHERETTSYYYGDGDRVAGLGTVVGRKAGSKTTNKTDALISNSLGDFYRCITEGIGFGFLQAGKTMGLAAYGDPQYAEDLMRSVKLLPNGQFKIAIEGPNGMANTIRHIRQGAGGGGDHFSVISRIAAAGQFVLEHILEHALKFLYSTTNSRNLCLAGGVALNAVFNGKIRERTGFTDVHVVFAPGDSGTAIGAAIFGRLHSRTSSDLARPAMRNPFLGRTYSSSEVVMALEEGRLRYVSPKNLSQEVAGLLADGLVVAWYQGKSEFGPRALGNRSILADPRQWALREHLNRNIKEREWFRPFGAAVIESEASRYFETDSPSPFMQFAWPVRQEWRSKLPAITHVDGGSRIQTVSAQASPTFFDLLNKFYQYTGCPLLLNTSFNIKGLPIAETPVDAVTLFQQSRIDALVVGDFLVTDRHGS